MSLILNSTLEKRICEFYKITATANFDLGAGNGMGKLTLVQDGCDDQVNISGSVILFGGDGSSGEENWKRNSQHGYHIHTKGVQEDNCGPSSTGGHFNPFDAPSGHFDNNRQNREVAQIGQLFCGGNGNFF